jgi:hypothetical protein
MRDRIEIYLTATGVEYTLPTTSEQFDAARAALAEIQGYSTPLEDRDGRWMFVALDPAEQAAFGRFLAQERAALGIAKQDDGG